MKQKQKSEPQRLVVKKETLRTLTTDELHQAGGAGGGGDRNNCTGRYSGCASCPG
jgi:hypothetical protein